MKYHFNKVTITAVLFVAIAATFGAGIIVGKQIQEKELVVDTTGLRDLQLTTTSGNLDLKPFWKAVDTLNEKFVPTTASSSVPTDQDKVWGAIRGLAQEYGDPYTVFFPPKETSIFQEEVRGDFEGIGVEITTKDGVLTVIAPLKGTPAERAGLKPGDQIIKIEKFITAGLTVDDAIKHIRGPKGTSVLLTIKRGDKITEVPVERDTINIPTIDTKLRDDGVFVISLYTFSANSPELFRGALREFILSGSDKLVLDLRGNPGGYLEAATDMASYFLPVGKTVVIEDSGTRAKQQFERSKGYNVFNQNLRMAVLINEGSASASEILAGALHEHGVAKLVGEKSFGKGSVQELIDITPDTALKVTIARWLTPLGHSISQNGLEPDIKVGMTQKDFENKRDPQMEKVAEILTDPNFKRN
ncbi:hypothetical protein AUJ77_02355 [Candidatus Nomurabacteria bacterium CG1_02_43_90]|uniref:PDZ domain-containing protein n=1 Tax=Candidatus Nomurabacteria bacterium CG1_02_43_90 TaxID=1805281 RepID=A0A1J4V0G2_9BACT|nr:MAG: hypothetical protein AUJ77_02355 [Candidatus Nomurabacteria bacterium CG1_02_43_90]